MKEKINSSFRFFLIVATILNLFSIKLLGVTWSIPTTISDTLQSSYQIELDSNDNNKTIASWLAWDGTNNRTTASLFSGATWDTPTTLSLSGEMAYYPKAAIDENDTAMVIWASRNGSTFSIQSSINILGSWSAASTISTGTNPILTCNLSMANNGAIVTWSEKSSIDTLIKASYYNGVTWSSPMTLSLSGYESLNPSISMNSLQHAFVIWQRYDTSNYFIEVSYFNGTSWSSSINITTSPERLAFPKVVINELGNAMAIWEKHILNVRTVRFALYDHLLSTWNAPTTISSSASDSASSYLSFNDSGNAVAVWRQWTGSVYGIHASMYFLSAWSIPILISDPSTSCKNPIVTLNNLDEAVAVFVQENLSTNINFINATSFNSITWDLPQLVSQSGIPTFFPRCTLNNNAPAWIGWTANIGNSQIRVSSGTLP